MNKIQTLQVVLTIAALSLCAGCVDKKQAENTLSPAHKTAEKSEQTDVEKKFKPVNQQQPGVVESALELSQKYAEASDRLAKAELDNTKLTEENKRLNEKLAKTGAELEQTKKELTQANETLIDFQIELNNWKENILGYRDEMRESHKAILESLMKIYEVLGAEVTNAELPASSDANNVQAKAVN